MSRAKKPGRQTVIADNAADNVRTLRASLGLSQERMAIELGVSRVAALRWENKADPTKPSAEAMIQLARLAKDKEPQLALWFLQGAGVDDALLRPLFSEIDRSFKEHERRQREESKRSGSLTVAIIRPITIRSSSVPLGEAEEFVTVPEHWFANPGSIFCIRLAQLHLVFVDLSQNDPTAIDGRVALAYLSPVFNSSHSLIMGRIRLTTLRGEKTPTPTITPDLHIAGEERVSVETVDPKTGKRGEEDEISRRIAGFISTPLNAAIGDRIIGRAVLEITSDPSFVGKYIQWT